MRNRNNHIDDRAPPRQLLKPERDPTDPDEAGPGSFYVGAGGSRPTECSTDNWRDRQLD